MNPRDENEGSRNIDSEIKQRELELLLRGIINTGEN